MISRRTLLQGAGIAGGGLILPTKAKALTPSLRTILLSHPNLPVTLRRPRATDDSAVGYAAGNYWNFNGALWEASSVTAGAASWTQQETLTTPFLDQLAGMGISVSAACGARLLSSTYTANKCIDVIRDSDSTTKTIGFVNGILDAATLDAFISGTVGRVSKWYDQSGNGLDATQATKANQPIVTSTILNGVRCITFDASAGGTVEAVGTQQLAVPSGLSLAHNSFTVIVIGRPARTTALWQIGTGGSAATDIYSAWEFADTNRGPSVLRAAGGVWAAAPYGSGDLAVIGYTSGAAFSSWFNDFTTASIATFDATAVTSATVGYSPANSTDGAMSGAVDMQAIIFIPSALTSTQIASVNAAAYEGFGIQPQVRANVVMIGDSITAGVYAAQNQNLSVQLRPMLGKPATLYNFGSSGSTTAAFLSGNMASNWAAKGYVSGASNVALLWLGTNDIAAGTANSTILSNLQSLSSALRTVGYKVIVVDCLPRSWTTFGSDSLRLSLNSSIASGWGSWADGYAAVGSDPTMGPAAAVNNTALYADGTHPTALGYTHLVPTIAAAINALQ